MPETSSLTPSRFSNSTSNTHKCVAGGLVTQSNVIRRLLGSTGRITAISMLGLLVAGSYAQPVKPGTPTPLPKRPTQPAPAPTPAPEPDAPQTTPTTPADPIKPAAPTTVDPSITAPAAEPKLGPYLTFSGLRDMNLQVRVRVLRGNSKQQVNDPLNGTSVVVEKTEAFDPMTSIAMVWPVIPGTGSASTMMDQLRGSIILDDAVVSAEPKFMTNYQGGVQYARFDAAPGANSYTPRKVELQLTLPVSVSKTEFDEKAAMRLPRPSRYPTTVAQWLSPQLYVEQGLDPTTRAIVAYDTKAVEVATQRAANAAGLKDFSTAGVVETARAVTHFVWGAMQLTTAGISNRQPFGEVPPMRLSRDRAFTVNDFGGVIIQPPVTVLEGQRGSQYDAVALLTAMLRKAGVPARPVIGYDTGSSGNSGRDNDLNNRSSRDGRGIRVWVEFALFDEERNTINWIPVDIAKLMKSSSRPMPLNKPWRYFGTHDELNNVVPFAFHFFPPTDVVSYGAPAFWGWFVTPKAPDNAGQAVMISAAAASKRSEDMPGRNNQPRKEEKKDKDKGLN